ncbi:MAG: DUF3450 domain-containing protein [Verrucomicrobia bacterium]|nr:DUF3450 domain-containing protein [Verrucomicrobiota bacterium]
MEICEIQNLSTRDGTSHDLSNQTTIQAVERTADKRMKTNLLAWISVGILSPFISGQAQSTSVSEGKQIVQKWIEARKLISQEKADWIEDKSILDESVRVFQKQTQDIAAEISNAQESSSKTQGEYDKLLAENEDIISATEMVLMRVKQYEQKIRKLVQKLPATLQERLAPLTNRLPEDSDKSTAPVTVRMQVAVGILSEIEKFQNAITLVNELRTLEGGEEIEVQTLYLGLGQAFYSDQEGKYAGRGIPGPDGWNWKEQQGLGKLVRMVIDQYQEKATASFLGLPVEIQNK